MFLASDDENFMKKEKLQLNTIEIEEEDSEEFEILMITKEEEFILDNKNLLLELATGQHSYFQIWFIYTIINLSHHQSPTSFNSIFYLLFEFPYLNCPDVYNASSFFIVCSMWSAVPSVVIFCSIISSISFPFTRMSSKHSSKLPIFWAMVYKLGLWVWLTS